MRKNIGKNISKTVSSAKYCQKLLDHAKQSTTDAIKTASKRRIQKTAESNCDLTDNKIADKIKFQNLLHRKIQSEMKKKYLEKDMYLQKKGRKFLMI